MIKPQSVEKALFRWPQYVDAIFRFNRNIRQMGEEATLGDALALASDEIRQLGLGQVDTTFYVYDALWRRPRRAQFNKLHLDAPLGGEIAKPLAMEPMPVYFICCALCFFDCWTRRSLDLEKIRCPQALGGDDGRVYPLPIFSKRDFQYGPSVHEDHPVWHLASYRGGLSARISRDSIRKECAELYYKEGLSEGDIGRLFGWKTQAYRWERLPAYRGEKTDSDTEEGEWEYCKTAERNIELGRGLLSGKSLAKSIDELKRIRHDAEALLQRFSVKQIRARPEM